MSTLLRRGPQPAWVSTCARARGAALATLVFLGLLHGALPAPAQPAPPSTARGEGLQALREKRFDAAREAFQRDLAATAQGTNQAGPWFYLALTEQQAADAATTPAQRDTLLSNALAAYESADRARPGTAGILNNLAQVHLRLGRTNEALATFAQALEAPDSRRPLYARHYADALLEAGRWRDACRFYAWVAGEQPQDDATFQRLTSLCLERGPDLLGWYLWDLARAGHVLTVARHALAALPSDRLSPDQREELAAIVAFCLTRLAADRSAFAASDLGRAVETLRAHAELGPALNGLWLLHTTNAFPEAAFRWWNRPQVGAPEPARGIPPHAAFQELARSLARRELAADRKPAAEALLLAGIRLRPGRPDPEALLELANLFAEQRRIPEINALLQQYRVELFAAKGEAYAAADVERIYRYHMTLGVIYSHTERWTSPGGIDSAEFQLRNALRAADELESRSDTNAATRLRVPPELVALLADGYDRAGQPAQAARVRLDRAERYLAHQQLDEANLVARPIINRYSKGQAPPGIDTRRIQKMKTALDRAPRSASLPLTRARAAGATPLQIEVEPNAVRVAGAAGEETLSPAEREALTQSIRSAVATPHAPTDAIRSFPTAGVQ
ncbi:MAG: tetratricopeptide repeat protein, partial [Verrucomicrobiales bacterium]|nr:tetratricopeptide repeat protein [Verrucomicrobiales bacterium]